MRRFLLLPFLLTFGACSNPKQLDYKAEVQAEFTKAYSCPKDRVTVVQRTDLKAFALQVEPQSPPREIAMDPGRLEVWTQRQKETEKGYEQQKVFEAQGCAQHAFYTCGIGESTNAAQVVACGLARRPPSK